VRDAWGIDDADELQLSPVRLETRRSTCVNGASTVQTRTGEVTHPPVRVKDSLFIGAALDPIARSRQMRQPARPRHVDLGTASWRLVVGSPATARPRSSSSGPRPPAARTSANSATSQPRPPALRPSRPAT